MQNISGSPYSTIVKDYSVEKLSELNVPWNDYFVFQDGRRGWEEVIKPSWAKKLAEAVYSAQRVVRTVRKTSAYSIRFDKQDGVRTSDYQALVVTTGIQVYVRDPYTLLQNGLDLDSSLHNGLAECVRQEISLFSARDLNDRQMDARTYINDALVSNSHINDLGVRIQLLNLHLISPLSDSLERIAELVSQHDVDVTDARLSLLLEQAAQPLALFRAQTAMQVQNIQSQADAHRILLQGQATNAVELERQRNTVTMLTGITDPIQQALILASVNPEGARAYADLVAAQGQREKFAVLGQLLHDRMASAPTALPQSETPLLPVAGPDSATPSGLAVIDAVEGELRSRYPHASVTRHDQGSVIVYRVELPDGRFAEVVWSQHRRLITSAQDNTGMIRVAKNSWTVVQAVAASSVSRP